MKEEKRERRKIVPGDKLGIYTSLEDAKEEIWRRWNDKELKKKVEDFLGGDIPDFLQNEPKAYLAKHIASPNNDFLRFLELSGNIGMRPVCLEYIIDKFISENKDKYHLARIFFQNKNEGSKKDDLRADSIRLIDFCRFEGKPFCEIETLWGGKLVDFHHEIVKKFIKEDDLEIFDASDWITKIGRKPENLYLKYLSFFVAHGILFENFVVKDSKEFKFTKKIVLPSINRIKEVIGIEPIIVPLNPPDEESNSHWRCYDFSIKKLIGVDY